jgi:hypothetical protein
MVEVFREVRRVLRKDGTVWLNLGDSYAQSGGKQKDAEELARKGMVEIDGRDAIYMDGILKKTVEIFNDD